ncbi:MAG TPA: NAD(P)H-hydrate dehydratase, partial [Candidatus Thermoplasmatota archaeon]
AAAEVAKLKPRNVLIVCGPGNNGGDGLSMAPYLPDAVHVRFLLSGPVGSLKTPEARQAAARLDPAQHPVEVYRTPERFRELAKGADLIVDALLGSGITGTLREPIRTLVRLINASRKPILSIDVPTGIGGTPAVKPTVTVTFHDKKPGMTSANSGRIAVRDIGIPLGATEEVGSGDFTQAYPRNPADSHKDRNGRVLVVSGGPYTGAPILCAQAAMRSGVDLVRLYTTRDAALAAQTLQPDLIVHQGKDAQRIVPADVAPIAKLLERVDVLLLGPGMGEDRETVRAIEGILEAAAKRKTKVVLDADALVVAGKHPDLVRRIRPICTPHAGEYVELTRTKLPKDPAAAKKAAAKQAAALRSVFLVKGAEDIITDGKRVKVNRIHHPAMTTGGTGDVLAGITAAFYSKGMDAFHAACAAAFVNGDAGRSVAARQGGTLVATDLIAELPRVFGRWFQES